MPSAPLVLAQRTRQKSAKHNLKNKGAPNSSSVRAGNIDSISPSFFSYLRLHHLHIHLSPSQSPSSSPSPSPSPSPPPSPSLSPLHLHLPP
jgi:hypothetical protein